MRSTLPGLSYSERDILVEGWGSERLCTGSMLELLLFLKSTGRWIQPFRNIFARGELDGKFGRPRGASGDCGSGKW
jgi:hypothetical protein